MAASELQPLQLQLKDVYAIAQSVGEQFQVLIQQFGNSYLAEVVDTVVNALEHLEAFVEDNLKLQARICKLLLNNDNLVKESEKWRVESQRNAATLASLEMENKRLILQFESLGDAHKINDSPYSLETKKENGCDLGVCLLEGMETCKIDVMEVPRMKRRLAQMENELKRTRTKLLNTQSTLKCIVSENSILKTELEESKAEIGLQTLQLKTQSVRIIPPNHHRQNHHESPKFYKKDLLIVLRERNELKEEVDALRDELNLTRLQLRYQHQISSPETDTRGQDGTRSKANTKVRSIVTSITADSWKDIKKEEKGTCKAIT